jgi:hypothetical protein
MMMQEREAFDRAFVALSYWLDRRGDELLGPLSLPHAGAVGLARRLTAPERTVRAQTLAVELNRVVLALESRRLR